MTAALLATLLLATQQRGGPPGVFIKEVPKHDLSAIQFDPRADGVSLSLMATRDLSVRVESSAKPDKATLELKANVPQTVRFSGAGAYKVVYEGGKVEGVLKTPRKSGEPFAFVVQADSHLDENSSADFYRKTLESMAADRPDFLVDLGDTFMTGKHAEYEEAIAQYRVQRYYLGLVGRSAPVFLVLGNHDGEQGWVERNQPGMTKWAGEQRERHFPSPSTVSRSAHYYALDWGDAQIIVLDPYHPTKEKPARSGDGWAWTLGPEQYEWLVKTLEASRPKYRFVCIHHLVGGEGKDSRGGAEASKLFEWGGAEFAAKRPGWKAPIHELLRRNGVDVVFHGHDHFFAKQERDGIVYQLVPQPSQPRGGAYGSAEEYGYHAGEILPGSGYIRVRVRGDGAAVEFVRDGEVACSYILALGPLDAFK